MEVVFLYITFVIIVTLIGSKKNRALGGFFLSLILSPLIGLVWVLVMSDPKVAKCPICKEAIQTDALKCKHCGAELAQTINNVLDGVE